MDNIKERNFSLDIARLLAVFAVVMVHCSADFVVLFNRGSTEFFAGNLLDSISRFGVPLFLMISGALFLDEGRQITIKGILGRNVKTLAVITLIWSMIYAVVTPLIHGKPLEIENLFETVLLGHHHMWYLYMIIGLYIATPFLKKIVCVQNKKMILFFVLISFALQFSMPAINILCNLGLELEFLSEFLSKFSSGFFCGYIAYFMLGWYIVHVGVSKKILRIIAYILSAASLVLMIIYVESTGDYKNAYANLGVLVFVYSAGIFLALTRLKISPSKKCGTFLAGASKLTFGVYLVHILILDLINENFDYTSFPTLHILVIWAVVLCASFLVVFALSKIPLIKKIIKA